MPTTYQVCVSGDVILPALRWLISYSGARGASEQGNGNDIAALNPADQFPPLGVMPQTDVSWTGLFLQDAPQRSHDFARQQASWDLLDFSSD